MNNLLTIQLYKLKTPIFVTDKTPSSRNIKYVSKYLFIRHWGNILQINHFLYIIHNT